jgi:hypothetical protein
VLQRHREKISLSAGNNCLKRRRTSLPHPMYDILSLCDTRAFILPIITRETMFAVMAAVPPKHIIRTTVHDMCDISCMGASPDT